jgi:hypothetical protein
MGKGHIIWLSGLGFVGQKLKGWLEVKDLRKMNISPLCKWWWKLETQNGLWRKIVRVKYFCNYTVSSVKPKFNDSSCWKAILKVKDIYMKGMKVILNNGELVRFWKDHWSGEIPMCACFPALFDVYQNQDCSIIFFVEMQSILLFL